MSSIAIINYNMGNLHSVCKALEHVAPEETNVFLSSSADEILNADRVVFPGQGAARDCMKELSNAGLIDVVREAAASKPFLGICMGMQVLLEHSEEHDGIDCIGVYKGNTHAFAGRIAATDTQGERLKIPQMGWNRVYHTQDHPLWRGIEDGSRFYFVHSYFVDPDDKDITAGTTEYGLEYASAIAKDNVFAIQAHPEKSSDDGLRLLKNFTEWDGTT
ncbi:MAG TPA: imidazole glycerol phosphate synthase subunit HisH [Leucothrix mucor]|nr:imidazole glycerol phosphate synthase subunit HisH [Leucothrix mucor]